ncbi:hypothetical protein [Alistipes onderdonkii]|uniref:hypothetical protein n=1 Tax=Alistipes onderdonkii TaxID=328813 RepID=UPI0012E2E7D4|nr:hypothetical protein [Alistipes onderdonkii]
MKKLNDTAIAVLAIVSTILSYLSWGLMALMVLLVPPIDNTNLISSFVDLYYIILLLFLLFLLWGCRRLYKKYNRAEVQGAFRRGQVLFIFLVSFTIKYFLNGIMLVTSVGALFIPYGLDIIFIIPISVFVNLKIAHRKIH